MPDDDVTVALFGEPFDTGLAAAERHLRSTELAAAQAAYERLLTAAESLDDDPDTRFLRAHLLTNIGMVQLERTDLAAAAVSHEQAIGLLRGIRSEPMGPLGRQLWLDDLLKALVGQADLLRRTGNLDDAQVCLEEAATWLPEFTDDGTRGAELGNVHAALLMSRGEWAAAEQAASMTLSAAPASVSTVPYLLANLGLICASTGRFDLAEDYFAQAWDALRAWGEVDEPPHLIAHRGYVAMRRGDLDRAAELYTEAAAVFEQRRQAADLAICEQARGFLAALRGDAVEAGDRMATSLSRFERLGLSIAAADTMLLASQQAYRRGDIAAMQHLSEQARGVYEAQGLYERCAQADFLTAASIEDSLNRSGYGEHEAAAVDAALALALPAALALEAARYDFATGHARSQWLTLADEAMRLVFRLAVRREDQGLLFELVELRCAGVPLDRTVLDTDPPSAAKTAIETTIPDGAMKAHGWTDGTATLGHAAADAAASEGLRVALPPKVLMSPGSDRTALREYVEAAESRYHRRIRSDETVPSW